MGGVFLGHVKLISEFADVPDANRHHGRMANGYDGGRQKGKGGFGEIIVSGRLKDIACAGAAEIDRGPEVGDIAELDAAVLRKVAANPGAIAQAEARARDHIEKLVVQMNDGHVGFNAAALVAQLGVDGLARRTTQIIGGNSVHRAKGRYPADLVLCKGGLVDECRPLADRLMFTGYSIEPIGIAFEARAVLGCFSGACKPIWAFPAEFGAHDGTLLQQMPMQGAAAQAARRFRFLTWPVNMVVGAIGLDGARIEIAFLCMERPKAPHIE